MKLLLEYLYLLVGGVAREIVHPGGELETIKPGTFLMERDVRMPMGVPVRLLLTPPLPLPVLQNHYLRQWASCGAKL